MSFQTSKPKGAANYRDRAAKQFNPSHQMFAENTGLNIKSPFMSKTLQKSMLTQNKKKKGSSTGSRQRRESAKSKKRSTSKKSKNIHTSADTIFSPKTAMFNNKKLSYGGNAQGMFGRGQNKGYSRNHNSGLTGSTVSKPSGSNWNNFGGSRFRTHQQVNIKSSQTGSYYKRQNMLN